MINHFNSSIRTISISVVRSDNNEKLSIIKLLFVIRKQKKRFKLKKDVDMDDLVLTQQYTNWFSLI